MWWVLALWGVGALVVLLGEMIAVLNDASGDTITETFKSRWWTRGLMGGLIVWSAWHFFTDEGGLIDLLFVAVGFLLGTAAYYLKLRRADGKR